MLARGARSRVDDLRVLAFEDVDHLRPLAGSDARRLSRIELLDGDVHSRSLR